MVKSKYWRRDDPLTAKRLNDTVDDLVILEEGIASPDQVVQDEVEDTVNTEVRAFSLVSVGTNTLSCLDLTNGSAVEVAKSPNLRGAATSRTVNAEDQVIVPAFSVGGTLFAVQPTGGTQLNEIVWQDLNVDARAWAESA